MKHLSCKRCGKPYTPDGRGNVCSPCYLAIVDPIARVANAADVVPGALARNGGAAATSHSSPSFEGAKQEAQIERAA
jgi:hypothetical protein